MPLVQPSILPLPTVWVTPFALLPLSLILPLSLFPPFPLYLFAPVPSCAATCAPCSNLHVLRSYRRATAVLRRGRPGRHDRLVHAPVWLPRAQRRALCAKARPAGRAQGVKGALQACAL
eukprot:365111-Chlamydomonas_euryale.AAC.12